MIKIYNDDSDRHKFSPQNVDTKSCRQVVRLQKLIKEKLCQHSMKSS